MNTGGSSTIVKSRPAKQVGIRELRNEIPSHCFNASYKLAFVHLFRDLFMASILTYVGYSFIPLVNNFLLRSLAWVAYGYAQGLVMTGFWAIAHECGHGSFFPSQRLNTIVGFVLHSIDLVPYFAWQSTHHRHHLYANNLTRDNSWVPPTRDQYQSSIFQFVQRLEEVTEDSPFITFFQLVLQQILGLPSYFLIGLTAAEGSLTRPKSKHPLANGHVWPFSTLFRPEEAKLIFISDIGLGLVLGGLWYASQFVGAKMVFLLYVVPWMWVNHWVVAMTYLHHTHPKLPKFEDAAWTFVKGATATVDRSYGWTGRFFFHNAIDFHVVHHLFFTIPCYHVEEASDAIVPLLGDSYIQEKDRSFLGALWETFIECQWLEPDDPKRTPEERAMFFRNASSNGRSRTLKKKTM